MSGVVERLRIAGKNWVIGQRKRIIGLDATTVTDPALDDSDVISRFRRARSIGSAMMDAVVVVEIPRGERNKYEVDHADRRGLARPDIVHFDALPV